MSALLMAVVGGALIAAALWGLLALRFLRPSLDELLADPAPAAPPPLTAAPSSGWLRRLGSAGAPLLAALGLPTDRTRQRLTVCDRDVPGYLAEKTAALALGVAVPPLLALVLALLGINTASLAGLGAWVVFAAVTWAAPDLALRDEAAKRQAALRHTLAAFADLVAISLAGGAGVSGALEDATRASHDWAMKRVRAALRGAAIRREPPWTALRALAERYEVPEFAELAASLQLAGADGARVRASLAAKATTLRTQHLGQLDADAQAATERMSLPVVVLAAGFLILIGYPALHLILTTL